LAGDLSPEDEGNPLKRLKGTILEEQHVEQRKQVGGGIWKAAF